MRASKALTLPGYITISAGVINSAVGSLALLGWHFRSTLLTSVRPGFPRMMPNTAVAMILSGLALLLLQAEPVPYLRRVLGQICGGLVLLIGLLVLCEYVTGSNFRIDQWLYRDVAGDDVVPFPGRPAFQS